MRTSLTFKRGTLPVYLKAQLHLALSRAVGNGMIGGIFVTPDWVAKNAHGSFWFQRRVGNAVMCCEIDPNALDVYLKGPGKMGRKLSTYSAALLGYRVRDDVEETVIALYYPDQANAERDAPQELKKQWDGFYANLDAKASVSDS